MQVALRKTNCEALGDVPWGAHLCLFYEAQEDLFEILLPYFKAGLAENELCVWVISEPLTVEETVQAVRRHIPESATYLARGQIEFADYREWYLQAGRVAVETVVQDLFAKEQAALQRGFDGLRVAGDTFWLEPQNWQAFMAYEAAIDNVLGRRRRILAVCAYALEKCSAREVIDVINSHDHALVRRAGQWQPLDNPRRKRAEETLRTYQIELETANEELRASQSELTASHHKYVNLYDFAPVGYCTLDSDGRILEANLAAANLFGIARDRLITTRLYQYLVEADRDRFYLHLRQLAHDQSRQTCELRLLTPDRAERWARLETISVVERQYRTVISDITDRKHAEERFAKIFYASPIAMGYGTVETGRFIDLNQRYAELFGYSREELLGMSAKELWANPAEREAVVRMLRAQGSARNIEARFRCKSGEIRDGLLSMELLPITGELYVLAIVIDITDRKRMELALQEREALYRQMFLGHSAVKLLIDPDTGAIVEANPASAQFYGYPLETLQQMNLAQINTMPPAQIARTFAEAQTHRNNYFVFQHKLADGTVRDVEVYSVPITIHERTLLYAIIHDITERRRAEEEIKALAKFPSENPSPVLRVAKDGTILYANAASIPLLNAWGCQEGQSLPEEQYAFMLDVLRSASSKITEIVCEDCIFSLIFAPIKDANYVNIYGRDITRRKQVEIELRQYQEHLEELILARTRELQDANRQLAREIAERQQIEDALQKAKDAAETANRAKSRFLANMSHELRSPLNAILGFSQLLERSPDATARQREYLEIINRSGAHLLELINDVLELSKIEVGQSEVTITTVDLRQTLSDLETLLHVRADQKHLRLIFEIAADVPQQIQTDQRKLRQVLINLLENAVKFTAAGQVALRVACEMAAPQTDRVTLRFEVADTGAGIAAAEVPKLFTAFTQTASGQQQAEGTGLGLALSRQFAQLLGGDLTVASQPGQGTTFTFSLPAQLAGASEQPLPRPARRVIGLAPAQPACRILVVEDDPASQNHLCILLQELGFSVQAADDGAQAIMIYNDWQPHLILMDMRMPIMDGYAATRAIRALENGHLPIIAVTASAFEEERAAILAAGCDGFIRKPFWGDDILEVIQRQLGVQYRYAAPEDRRAGEPFYATEGIRDAQQLSERMAALAPAVLANLERAAFESDIEAVDSLLAHIRACDAPIADALTTLSNNFNYDEIVRIIQETKPKHGDGL